jgi:tetratricopeptide (TPR) repeat protein
MQNKYSKNGTNKNTHVCIYTSFILCVFTLGILISNSLDYTIVLGQTNKINETTPNYVTQNLLQGAALFKLGKYNESIPYFDKVLYLDPNNTNALYNKGFALFKLGKYNESKPIFDMILSKK